MTTVVDAPSVVGESTPQDVCRVVAAAAAAAPAVVAATPAERAAWLCAIADAVVAHADSLAALAHEETGLGLPRLDGEVLRCANQLRFYADVCIEGSWLGATIDHATATTPDLRRIQASVGPVAVFGASNFPFGFGTLGNDTGSAIAAGSPVVVKGHPAHPRTHAALMDIAHDALADIGAPEGLLSAVTGLAAGEQLVLAPEIAAVAFTGSEAGGLALHRLAATRPIPIPVYAEMGTVNAVVLTTAAVHRLADLAQGALASFTMGMGQFCTKPGLILAPAGCGFAARLGAELHDGPPTGVLLTVGIHEAFGHGVQNLLTNGAFAVARSDASTPIGPSVWVLEADASLIHRESPLLRECFGPVVLVVEYADAHQRDDLIAALPGALVASVMTGGSADDEVADLVKHLAPKVGRVAVDAWPTGVATLWAQQHGGPWPATTDPRATSVGAAALARFTRPVAYQGTPQAALPVPLQDKNAWRIVRRVNGRLRVPREPKVAQCAVP
ncbi:aldehyde dehydrogenase family protein [Nostocoides vanveenii]|uniref:Aldehyde dehydrogenase (NADP(+)) n=1 Tax=Nostocoides vanveenii TaxID=330835 RepID=A0ABN2KUV7_9MICO